MVNAINIILLLTLTGAENPKVAVFGFQGIGIDSIIVKEATSLFRQELNATKKFNVVTDEQMIQIFGNDRIITDVSDAQITAKIMVNASKAIIGILSKLENQTLVKVQLIDAINGKIEYTDELIAADQKELDNVIKKLVISVATKKKATDEINIIKISKKDELKSIKSITLWQAGLGFGSFIPIGNSEINQNFSCNYSIVHETNDFLSELRYTLYQGFNHLTFNLFKFQMKRNLTPYYGGGLGLAWTYYGSGFVLTPGCGILFLRTSYFQLMTDLRYHLFYNFEHFQHGVSINLSFVYRRDKRFQSCYLW